MNITYTSEQNAFRQEVRAWLAQHKPKERFAHHEVREGFQQHRAWEQTLADAGLSMVTWPKGWGGQNRDLFDWLIFEEEYYAADAPFRVNQNGMLLLGPTLMEFGTEEQKQKILPRMARCEDMWAQAWSEPGAGSDMAAIRSRAEVNGDRLIINGQKTWSTRALFANWAFGLFRTDPQSERHHGLSYLMVPLDAKGVTVRPIKALNGKAAFAELFFDDVEVGLDHVIGEVNKGWHVAMATAGFERALLLRSPARFLRSASQLMALVRQRPERLQADPTLLADLVRVWSHTQAYQLNAYWSVSRYLNGEAIGAESSANKIFWSE
ncbi:MAG: acyl-CoA dehydrogenase, partial [Betaproteobacteria bacterium]|nr:acyl-CoA dehydrogenase [Betaproteobacteria bacterium]